MLKAELAPTLFIQPLLLVVGVQQSDVELTGVARRRLAGMLVACYCGCRDNDKSEETERGLVKHHVHSPTLTFRPHGFLAGRLFFGVGVQGAAGGGGRGLGEARVRRPRG